MNSHSSRGHSAPLSDAEKLKARAAEYDALLAAAGYEPLLKIKEAAAAARMDYSSMWRLVTQRQIPASKPGHWLILRTDLAAFLAAREA